MRTATGAQAEARALLEAIAHATQEDGKLQPQELPGSDRAQFAMLTALVLANLASVEATHRVAEALERIADRLETEPVNDSTTHLPYERPEPQDGGQ